MTTGDYSPRYLAHEAEGHPESPARLAAAWAQVQRHGLLLDTALKEPDPIALADLERVHQRRHIQLVEALAADGGGWVDGDTFVAAASYDAALRAAGAAVEACAAVLGGQPAERLCPGPPPGHHAPADRAMGFCLFNNVAVGAAWALAAGRAQRVLIVDFDVHHGNGTQDIFYNRSDVCFFSVHQYPLYPGRGRWARRARAAGPLHDKPAAAAGLRRRDLRPRLRRGAGAARAALSTGPDPRLRR